MITPRPRHPHWLRTIVLALGALAVLVGGADMVSRLSSALPGAGNNASFAAFAPLAALDDPAVRSALGETPAAAPITPARITVPSLNIDAAVEPVGRKADGTMGTPSSFSTVAWYSIGSKPGGPGNAVFAGHVNNALTTSGVFADLSKIKFGARIELAAQDGTRIAYAVTSIEEYPADSAPAEAIFATEGPSQIILITCDGEWDDEARSFDKRFVVVARPL